VSKYESRPASEFLAEANNSILSTALTQARAGIPVFPCHANGNKPLVVGGFKAATADEERIREWWRRWPDANVAMPTGIGTFDVLDVSVRPAGDAWGSLARLGTAGLLAGLRSFVRTPSGGVHIYFDGTDQRSAKFKNQHLTFKATGGYVLLPPSRVTTGSCLGAYVTLIQRKSGGHLDRAAVADLLQLRPTSTSSAALTTSGSVSNRRSIMTGLVRDTFPPKPGR
jgi:hypothetical protein